MDDRTIRSPAYQITNAKDWPSADVHEKDAGHSPSVTDPPVWRGSYRR